MRRRLFAAPSRSPEARKLDRWNCGPSTAQQGQFGDDFTLESQHAVGDYDIVSHNNLLGLQIGAEMSFRTCRWAWGVHGKLGPYINLPMCGEHD